MSCAYSLLESPFKFPTRALSCARFPVTFQLCSSDEGASSVLPSDLDAELGFRFASVTTGSKTGSWTYYVEPAFDGV